MGQASEFSTKILAWDLTDCHSLGISLETFLFIWLMTGVEAPLACIQTSLEFNFFVWEIDSQTSL